MRNPPVQVMSTFRLAAIAAAAAMASSCSGDASAGTNKREETDPCVGASDTTFPPIKHPLSTAFGPDGYACYGRADSSYLVYIYLDGVSSEAANKIVDFVAETAAGVPATDTTADGEQLGPREYQKSETGRRSHISGRAICRSTGCKLLFHLDLDEESESPIAVQSAALRTNRNSFDLGGSTLALGDCSSPPAEEVAKCREHYWLSGMLCNSGEKNDRCNQIVEPIVAAYCDHLPGQGCPIGLSCLDNVCCPWGWSRCGSHCYHPKYCETCNVADQEVVSRCVGCQTCLTDAFNYFGECVDGCWAGKLDKPNCCGDRCVDKMTDTNNCGGCGNYCDLNHICQDGVCTCGAGLTACGTRCVDLQTNNHDCGACSNACDAGESCIEGKCVCAAPNQNCAGKCYAIDDNSHCGDCSTVCSGVFDTCCYTPGGTANHYSCVSLDNEYHCGSCGNHCGANNDAHSCVNRTCGCGGKTPVLCEYGCCPAGTTCQDGGRNGCKKSS